MKIVILTASTMKKEIDGKQYSGKCVTGYDLESNKMVRLVQNVYGAPIESPCCDRYIPMNVYALRVKRKCPKRCQTENVYANYHRAIPLGKYSGGIEGIYRLWKANNHIEPSFMNDGERKLADIAPYDHSLEIIKVSALSIEHKKCSFIYNKKHYTYVSITDPKYTQDNEGVYRFESAFLVVSIPVDDYDGYGYFKFVASVFPKQTQKNTQE